MADITNEFTIDVGLGGVINATLPYPSAGEYTLVFFSGSDDSSSTVIDNVGISETTSTYQYTYGGYIENEDGSFTAIVSQGTGTQISGGLTLAGQSNELRSLGSGQTLDVVANYTVVGETPYNDYPQSFGLNPTDYSYQVIYHFVGITNAPVITAGSVQLRGETEGAGPPQGTAGTFVYQLDSAMTDYDPSIHPGIAITAVDTTHGAWQYSLDGTHWYTIGSVSESNALLLPPTAQVYFQPNANFIGSAGITFHAWDQTSGTAGETYNIAQGGTGGFAPFSAGTATASVAVTGTHFVVTDEASLNTAIAAIDKGGTDLLPNAAYTIDFALPQADSHILKLTSPLDAINLASGSSLTINGLDTGSGVTDTIDGGGTERGLFVYSGKVSIENLTIANAAAQGGAGGSGGGGGGAGLGGGLFVASGASVTLDDVNFSGDAATGGAGSGGGGHAGGGGGMGGAGGAGYASSFGSGGGGGIGTDATGINASIGGSVGPGIIANLPATTADSGSGGGGGSVGQGGGVDPTGSMGGFGGGGGGGASIGSGGGFGGGGGGGAGAPAAEFGETIYGYGGGTGGFGGGGGAGPGAPFTYGGATYTGGAGGLGGFGAGNGGNNLGSGGGGLAAGGDIFVQSGGSLTIAGGAIDAGTVNRSGGYDQGEAYGSGIFLQGNQTSITLAPAKGDTETINGVIADMSGSVDSTGGTTNGTGAGSLVIGNGTSQGTVVLAPVDAAGNPIANTFTGGITVESGTLKLASAGAAGTGTIHAIDPTIEYSASGTYANAIELDVGTPATSDPTTFEVDSGVTATISGAITAGSGTNALGQTIDPNQPIVKSGSGTLVLSNVNTYTGGTTVTGGGLSISADDNLGAGTLALSDGTTLDLTAGFTLAHQVTIAGSATFDVTAGQTVTDSGQISNAAGQTGDLVKTDTGTLKLSNSSNNFATLTINGGTVLMGSNAALDKSTAVSIASGATLDLGGFEANIGALAGAGTVTDSGNAQTFTLNTPSPTTFSGVIEDGAHAVSLEIKAGDETLSGANTYSGTTNIEQGSLIGGAANAFSANSNVTLSNGATLDLGGFDQTIGLLSGVGSTAIVTNSGATAAALATGGSGNSSFGGKITDGTLATTGLTKVGAGTLTLSSTDSYSGATTVSAGTLQTTSTTALSVHSDLTVATGAKLDLDGRSGSVGSLAGGGTVTNNGGANAILTAGGDNASTSFGGTIKDGSTHSIGLAKTGTGTLTLSGDNTYSDGTTIEGGTLEIGAAAAAGTGAITFGSGSDTLKFDAAISTTTPLEPTNTIMNFAAGDTIDLSGLAYNTADQVSYNGSNQVTVTNGSGGTLAQFAVGGLTPSTSSHLALAPDSTGDTNIVVANDADPVIQQVSGPGTLSLVGDTYTLNLGTVYQGEEVDDTFNIVNDVQGPADSLSGTSNASGDTAFSDTGLGDFGPLSAGGTTPISIDFNPQSPGAFTQTITVAETDSNASGFDEALAGQTIVVTGAAYGPAEPSITFPTIYVHQGDDGGTASGSFIVSNTAPANGYSENLIAHVVGFGPPATAASGLATVTSGASNDTALQASFATGNLGSFSGNVAIALQSDGNGIDSEGITSLGTDYVPVTIDVDNYASAAIQQVDGPAALSQTDGTDYTLDFGTVDAGHGVISADLDVANAVTGPADWLSGLLSANGDAAFSDTGLGAFSPLAAGESTPFAIGLDTTNVGSFAQTITVQLTDSNPSGYSAALNDITLTVEGSVVACYVAGTLIETRRGQKKVEKLEIGDEVMTASGALRPIKWIGKRSYGGRFIIGRKDILPVCFKAGSLGDDMPKRDLWISPHHAMYFETANREGVLIEAKDLVNGVSIVQAERVEQVEYFHIELDTHDVILAEGAPSESFVDDDSRGMFHNAREHAALYPEQVMQPARYCAPRLDVGYEVEAIRRTLAARAGSLADEQEAGTLRGQLDVVKARLIKGWAQNIDHPEAPVCLDIFAGGQLIGQTLANRYRGDLEAAGLGSGRHGFSFTPPDGLVLLPGTIEVRRALDGAPLAASRERLGTAAA